MIHTFSAYSPLSVHLSWSSLLLPLPSLSAASLSLSSDAPVGIHYTGVQWEGGAADGGSIIISWYNII